MARKYSIGLASIKMGAIAGDGGMGTSLTQITDTVPGSARIVSDEPTVTNITIEEEDDPVISSSTPGTKRIEFSSRNMSADALVLLFGGTKTTGPPEKWAAPSAAVTIEQSFELIDKKGNKYEVPRAQVIATFNAGLTRDETAQITVVATILVPTKSNTSPLTITYAA